MYASVSFRGGPLGGELRRMENPPRRLQVPSLVDIRVYAVEDPGRMIPEPYDLEEYELRPAIRSDGQDFDYIWVNPAVALRKRVTELTEQLESSQAAAQRAWGLVDELSRDADKWNGLRDLVSSLTEDTA